MKPRTVVRAVGLTLAILCWAAIGPAQVATVNYYGIVADQSGAVIPGATVTLTNEGTGGSTSKTTDMNGEFMFDFLRVGSYELRIEAEGFKSYQSRGIQLAAGQRVRQTFTLEVGAVTESVEVAGAAPLVNTVSAEQLETVGTTEVTELPLGRRNFTALLRLNTGITEADGAVRLNGLGKSGTIFTVDGTDATADPESRTTAMRGNFHYVNTMSIEAISEVQTVKGVVPAEYGMALAGNVNLISKSGTNEFHGSLFENFQAENLNARNPFLSRRVPETFNQFGGSLGGPVLKDRVFFFTTYEGYRESAFRQVSGNVPTEKLRKELVAAVPAYAIGLDRLPLPNEQHAPDADVGFFNSASKLRGSENHLVAKGDIRITDTSNLALTYTRGRPYRLTPRLHINNDREYQGTLERGTASYVMGGPTWTSETRFGYNNNDMERIDAFFLDGADSDIHPFGNRPPQLSSSLGFSTPAGELWGVYGDIWSLEHKYARHVGSHSLKLGGKFVHYGGMRTNPETPSYNYASRADLFANIPNTAQFTFGNGLYNGENWDLGFFAQDDWRVSRKLVLNLGIRWDFFRKMVAESTSPGDEFGFYNLDGLRDDQFNFGPMRDPGDPYESDGWVNLGPRIGFSYNPDGEGKTTIRGGFGVMFSSHIDGFLRQNVGSPTVPFRVRFSKIEAAQAGIRFPNTNDVAWDIVEKRAMETGTLNVFGVFNPQIQNPYSMNLYLGIQRALSSTLVLETAFVGNRGVKFPLHRVFNQQNRITGVRPNTSLGEGYYADNSQTSRYASWQTSLRKRYAKNLTAAVHYTWGKSLATENGDIGAYYQNQTDVRVQDFFNLRDEWGPSDGDITHFLSADAVYDLPAFSNLHPVARGIIGGWQVSGIFTSRTGEPLLITQGPGRNTSRPDYIGGEAVLSNYRDTLQYLNPAAFARVPYGAVSGRTIRAGNLGMNAVRAAGAWNLDFSFGKNFAITEGVKLQFRADSFNFFNHTRFGRGFSIDAENPRFGKFTSALPARVFQLNARLSF